MKPYESLFKQHKEQPAADIFSHFHPINQDYDAPYQLIADKTLDGQNSWKFQQERFIKKYGLTKYPKLKNYLNYTFKRLLDLQLRKEGSYFQFSEDGEWASFNTGLQNVHGADILAVFQKYKPQAGKESLERPDYVYKGCSAPNEHLYRNHLGTKTPDIAWYSNDSRDFVFDTSYQIEKDVFDHLFERAKQRAGLPNASDEVVRNYLRGALENIIPKIRRNYKVAIPVYYVEEKRMQLLLPFVSASDANDVSCFLIDRDDQTKTYRIKTIFDLDQAYFSARLITRPDKDWLNP